MVLVVWDTCRGDRVSVNGYGRPTTPRLARLAASGTTFRRCYTPSPWTPPSHASMFTGLLPSGHGLREQPGARVHPSLPLLASTLSGEGYETVAASANILLAAHGLLEGFDVVLPPSPGVSKDGGEVIVARLDRWLRDRGRRRGPRRPLFLFVNLMDSHLPLEPPARDVSGALGGEGAAALSAVGTPIQPMDAFLHLVGTTLLPEARLRGHSAIYDAAVHAADRATGDVVDLLAREGLLGGSVVAVVGDHGECLGEHGEMEHSHSLLDAVLHVPLVVRWPGRLDAGRTEDAQVRVQDVYRTLLDAAGVGPPQGCGSDSISLAAVPLDPRVAVAELGSCFEQHRGTVPGVPETAMERFRLRRVVIREAATGPSPRKYVVAARDGPRGEPAVADEALFDLRVDPGEDRNLLGPGGSPEDRAAADRLRAGFTPLFR
jgi:arylsulfatase A-like enzyme